MVPRLPFVTGSPEGRAKALGTFLGSAFGVTHANSVGDTYYELLGVSRNVQKTAPGPNLSVVRCCFLVKETPDKYRAQQ